MEEQIFETLFKSLNNENIPESVKEYAEQKFRKMICIRRFCPITIFVQGIIEGEKLLYPSEVKPLSFRLLEWLPENVLSDKTRGELTFYLQNI